MGDYLKGAKVEIDRVRRENYRLKRLVTEADLDVRLYRGLVILFFLGFAGMAILALVISGKS